MTVLNNMKHLVLYIIFFLALVLTGTGRNSYIVTESCIPPIPVESDDSPRAEARTAEDPCITACIVANSYADVSVSQTPRFGNNSMRRYRPAGFSFEKLFVYLVAERKTAQINLYRNALYDTQEYSARLKSDGYYIYTLRKIIV